MTTNLVLRSSRLLNRLTDRIEQASWLDRPCEWAAGVLGQAFSPPMVKDLLAGSPVGHPLHPPLVAIPIGSWTAAACLDLLDQERGAARKLVALGVVAALPTALSGMADWSSTAGAERRVGVVHAGLNVAALALYSGSWWVRKRGDDRMGVGLSMLGLATISASGWLGGHLVYALGVGVDTTSFQQLPGEWTDAGLESDLAIERPMRRDVAGVPVLVVRSASGIYALADRCTHRGGPLHEGDVAAGCVTCPWHGSIFRLADGEVVSGPASRRQTVLEVQVVDGRVQVRRSAEPRALRTNPVGA
jgi:nitrite reductase/ring-hydroxylating ferredoxin subunit/uncharacterized membrane protein